MCKLQHLRVSATMTMMPVMKMMVAVASLSSSSSSFLAVVVAGSDGGFGQNVARKNQVSEAF